MKKIKNASLILAILVMVSVIFYACKKDKTAQNDGFDRKTMLQNYADNLIKPAFADLQMQVNTLKTATDAFTNAPDEAKLISLKTAFDNAYSSFMYANAYNFGPAGEEGIRKGLVEEIGTWPANTQNIEKDILANDFTLGGTGRDKRGLNAVDYLVYNFTVADYNASPNRKLYLQAVVNKIKLQVDAVASEWNGAYYTTFINNTGTDVGSSTAQLYNEFIRGYESVKNLKLGLPLGKRVGQEKPEPSKVEALYSKQSLKYLKLNITAINNVWYGKSKIGVEGLGFKAYLNSVTGGPDLVIKTEAQIKEINNVINLIPTEPSLENQITLNNLPIQNLFTELQKNIRNYKSDMSSLLGIAITFSSGDGD
ncbi:MAG: hypothetical protein EAZ51_07120 [Sphingobacteriales bacterium]|nr:MAG: hypothetical protein EAZ64_09365 [Sphingobacteriales bacterium]TAF79860.1 MAG: hypothetical protein EAZ51_07120 [Sphingobacteriales bacterium]